MNVFALLLTFRRRYQYMMALANLWGSVGNLRVLFSTSSAFVNLRVPKRLNDCNEHSRHFWGVLSVTFDYYR